MKLEVVTPEDYLGNIIGDLSRRRGKVQGQEQRGNALAVQAFVPLGEMFGYATDVRSSTQGRATYTMQFERYEEVPQNIAERDRRAHAPASPSGARCLSEPTLAGYIPQVGQQPNQFPQTALRDTNQDHPKERDVQGEVRSR